MFFPDWVDFNKIAIPQADEQQRLLANLITEMSLDRTPLPRFWYLPRGEKAAVVMTGDDHAQGRGGTVGQFQWFESRDPAGCSVADWQCVRSTSYAFPGADITRTQATTYQSAGFEIALHLNTNCHNYTEAELADAWESQLADFAAAWPGSEHAEDQPDALHHLGRLGGRGEGRGSERRPAGHELLLLAGHVGERPARDVHRLGLPDALRRRERRADRRLPGGDAAHRRVGHRHPDPHQGAARRRARQRRLLRRLHRQHAHRRPRPPGRAGDRRRGAAPAACPSCRRPRCSTGSTAATARRSAD